MSDAIAGNCLVLYLQNYALVGSLEEQDSLPPELKEEEQLFSAFGERARDQAAGVLESLYTQVINAGVLPYRIQRRSQRRTVREQWRMDGAFLRPREKMARNFWSLCLGALRDKGPAACLVLGPNEGENSIAVDGLANYSATILGLESANVRTCFSHDSDYHNGVLVGFSAIQPLSRYEELAEGLKEQVEHFLSKYRAQLEQALESA